MVAQNYCELCVIASIAIAVTFETGLAMSTTTNGFASGPSLPKSEIPMNHHSENTHHREHHDSAERIRLVQVCI
jgi:hypothetical protein